MTSDETPELIGPLTSKEASMAHELLAQRIASILEQVELRARLIQEEIDRRFTATQLQMDQRFASAENAVNTALISAEKAVTKAETAAEKRFEGVNEFRQTLTDQATTFPTRNEVNIRMDALAADLTRVNSLMRDIELRFTSRLDLAAGQDTGSAETSRQAREKRVEGYAIRGETSQTVITVIMIISVLVAVASTIALVLKK